MSTTQTPADYRVTDQIGHLLLKPEALTQVPLQRIAQPEKILADWVFVECILGANRL